MNPDLASSPSPSRTLASDEDDEDLLTAGSSQSSSPPPPAPQTQHSHNRRVLLQRQFSTTREQQAEYHRHLGYNQFSSVRLPRERYADDSFGMHAHQEQSAAAMHGAKDHHHQRNNTYPSPLSPRRGSEGIRAQHQRQQAHAQAQAHPQLRRAGLRPKPPPLDISAIRWDSGDGSPTSRYTSKSASTTSQPRTASPSPSRSCSPSPQSSPELQFVESSLSRLTAGAAAAPPVATVLPPSISSPQRSPRSPAMTSLALATSPRTKLLGHYFALPPLSPIPHSPQPSLTPTNHPPRWTATSPRTPPRSPMSPFSPRSSVHSSRSASPAPPYYLGQHPTQAMAMAQAMASQQQQHPPMGHLARLASRRRSNAVSGIRRRTSNFLELPVSDYEQRQRRYCSLPEHGYNPRQTNEIYRLRAFSISPKGALIKHGDQMASRRSRSSAGSTANTSRTPSRCASPHASRSASRDVSPMARSPPNAAFSFGQHGHDPHAHSSPWSSSHQSFVDEVEEEAVAAFDDDGPSVAAAATSAGPEDGQEAAAPDPVKYRVCMLGLNDTGKTALVNQFLTSEYMNTYDVSLDDEFGERSVSVVLDGEESELVFIDHTNGEMSVENTLSTYEPHACIVVYSVVDRESFRSAEEVLGYLWRVGYCDSHAAGIILVGNKVDLERSRTIQQDEGKKMATSFGAKFIEVSAGLQHNVDELLVGVLKQIRLRQEEGEGDPGDDGDRRGSGGGGGAVGRRKSSVKPKKKARAASSASLCKPKSSSPLHTLQVARDILARVCLNGGSGAATSKSCENLHVL